MRTYGKEFILGLLLICLAAPAAWSASPQSPGQRRQQKDGREGVIVGRLSVAEGEILRYVPEQKDWVVTVKDSPFGLEDAIYSGENSKAEFLIPNGTWVRIGANTQVQVIALKGDATETDVASGMARFIGRSPKTVLKATTPFGYAVGEPGAAFDVYVGDESVEVIALRGKVDFIHDVDGARYDATPGAMSILADNKQATAGDGKVDTAWDDWNISRDTLLVQNVETRGESVRYLPDGIREDAPVLDENGRWERVYYEGQYRDVWRPTRVEAGWAPYTVGRWTDWYGDYTWIPYEPWGYTTSHYGYWFWANDYWYWAPPVVSVGIGVPFWGIGFSWYPGRVGWCYSGVSIGWFPLLPWEPYYAHRWWGPWGFPYRGGDFRHDHHRYRHFDHATVVRQTDFHHANNYAGVRTRMDRDGHSSRFRTSPVVNDQALRHAGDPRARFNYTNRTPTSRPNQAVTTRVAENQTRFNQRAAGVNGRSIRQETGAARVGQPSAGARVAAPGTTLGGTLQGGGSRAIVQNPRSVQPSASPFGTTRGRGQDRGTTVQSNRGRSGPGPGAAGSSQVGTSRQGGQRSTAGVSARNRSTVRDADVSGRVPQGSRSGYGSRQSVSPRSQGSVSSGGQAYRGRSASPSYQGRRAGPSYQGRGVSPGYQGRSAGPGYQGRSGGSSYQGRSAGPGFQGRSAGSGYQNRGGGGGMQSVPHGGGGGGPQGGGGFSGGHGGGGGRR